MKYLCSSLCFYTFLVFAPTPGLLLPLAKVFAKPLSQMHTRKAFANEHFAPHLLLNLSQSLLLEFFRNADLWPHGVTKERWPQGLSFFVKIPQSESSFRGFFKGLGGMGVCGAGTIGKGYSFAHTKYGINP